jgi:hypothetical protein
MTDVINHDLTAKIIEMLLCGSNPDTIIRECNCAPSVVFAIMGSAEFSEIISEHLEKEIKINGLAALHNIKAIADDESANNNTRLRANQWIVEKAMEFNSLGGSGGSASTMTQDQLARRLKELQTEAIKRSKPIDTGVIDDNPQEDLSEMLDD